MYTLEQPYRHLIGSKIHLSQTVLTALLITNDGLGMNVKCYIMVHYNYSVNMQKYRFLDNLKLKKFRPTHLD